MTVHLYKSTDSGAPTFPTSQNTWPLIPEMLKALLVVSYTGVTSPGWVIKHDSVTSSAGKLVLEDPDGLYYFFEKGPSNQEMVVGISEDCDESGTMINYQSGSYNNLAGTGTKDTVKNGSQYSGRSFLCFYDDVSRAVIFQGSIGSTWTRYQSPSTAMDQYSHWLYMGSLKKADGTAGPKVLLASGSSNGKPSPISNESFTGTALIGDAGQPMLSGDFVRGYMDSQVTRTAPDLTGYEKPADIEVTQIPVHECRSGLPIGGTLLGYLRGIGTAFSGYKMDSSPDRICQWIDPDTYNADGYMSDRPMTIDGVEYWRPTAYYAPRYPLMSVRADWW